MSDFSLSWKPGGGGGILDALRRHIDQAYRGDVMSALRGDKPAQPSTEWSAEATLLALIEYRLARLEWSQGGCQGPKPKPLLDVAARLHALGLWPDGGDGTAGVPA